MLGRKWIVAVALAAALAFPVAATAGETVTNMDTNWGDESGYWVVFVAKAMSEGAPVGTIGVATGKGDRQTAGFGMSVQKSKPVAAALGAELVNEARTSDKEPGAITIIVEVSREQYDEVKAAAEKYVAIENPIDNAVNSLLNCTQDALDALGLRRPYRSGLAPPNPVTYYSDIPTMNRKFLKEDS